MIKIVLAGMAPAKKNSKRWIQRGGLRFLVPSERHETWHGGAFVEVLRQTKGVRQKMPLNVQKIEMTFYCADKRRRDSTNCAESIMDLLVDVGVIKDDNMIEVPELRLVYGGVVKENARTEIIIYL
jgi:Holliday junction resolvase RusA-like endonuclease